MNVCIPGDVLDLTLVGVVAWLILYAIDRLIQQLNNEATE